jgi:AcrR family transcriptional regulator
MKYPWDKWDKRGWERANKIGRTAAKLFSRKGFLETTMDEIAGVAKVSKGGIYYYFKSKTEVLFFVLSEYMDLILKDLEQHLSELEVTHDKLKFIILRHIELYANNLAEGKVLLHETHCLPKKYYSTIAEKERCYFQIVAGVLEDLFPNLVPKSKLTAVTFILFGMCNWIYSWYDPKGSITPQELAETIYELFLRGVRNFSAAPRSSI